jgi:hypothetical protein
VSGPGVPDPVPAGPPGTHRKAVVSVAYGVLAFAVIYVFPIGGLVLGVPSVTTGVHARREIAASKGALTGDSIAVIGIMVGAAAIVTVLLSWLIDLV